MGFIIICDALVSVVLYIWSKVNEQFYQFYQVLCDADTLGFISK